MKTKTIKFCCKKNCPVVAVHDEYISIGEEAYTDKDTGKEFGSYTSMTKEQFKDLVEAAKNGKFDDI